MTQTPLQRSSSSSPGSSKILMIRLSSLGDVILSSSALSAVQQRPGSSEVHWVVSREYASLLQGHPQITRLWEFDRASGFWGWLKLCERLWKEGFTEVYDLHFTLRSKVARAYFFLRKGLVLLKRESLQLKHAILHLQLKRAIDPSVEAPRDFVWRTLDKQRFRLYGFFCLKSLWPRTLLPTPLVVRFAKRVGGTGLERPDLRHLLSGPSASSLPLSPEFLQFAEAPYLCVMPSSRWDGKKWPVRNFFEVIQKCGLPVVVLGSKQDRESLLLLKLLKQASLPHYPGVGVFGFSELARVLAGSVGYLGNDTGLGHLAEAVGAPAAMIFGPTSPEMGFGPWNPRSRSISASLWCKPCGKDGRFCYRPLNRFACQKKVSVGEVLLAVNEVSGLSELAGGSDTAGRFSVDDGISGV
jgi:ADP-heptose:LPS heptosyltransferase